MMMNAFDVSAALFARGLRNLRAQLVKAEAHAAATGMDPSALLGAKLADDMYDLSVQAHWCVEGPKLAVAQLLGQTAVPLPEDAKTFVAIGARIESAVLALEAVDHAALEAGLARTIEVQHRRSVMTFRGDRYLTELAIPGFYFHATAAYAIMRHRGVPLQKGDFMGA